MQILCIGDVVGSHGCDFLRRTLPAFKPGAETPNQYHRRYPCDQQEGRKVFESAIRAASAKLMR